MVEPHHYNDGDAYVDDGCELAPRCLSCPFPFCLLYESKNGYRLASDLKNVKQIEGLTTKEAALVLQVGTKTVLRILARVKNYQEMGG